MAINEILPTPPAPLFSPSLCFRWGKGRPSKLLSSLFTSEFLQVLSATSLNYFMYLSSLVKSCFFNIIIVTTRINLRQNKLPWIYDCPAQCPNIEWYFLQTCCFYKLTPAGKMIFRVHFGIREYPAIQVFTITFIWIIATSQGAQLTCIGSKWVGEKLEHFEDFPVSCSRSSLWSWDKVFCLPLTTGSMCERWFLLFLVLSGVGGLLEEELVEGDATLEGKQSLVSTPRISSQVPFFDIHALIFKS